VIDEPFEVGGVDLFPAILVGFGDSISHPLDLPGIVSLQQQYAGHGCLQQALTGALLPLRGRRDAEALVADLDVLDCASVSDARIRARPDLAPLHLCWLDQYRPDQRIVLDRVLKKGPPLPQVIAAAEALVELDASEPLRFFGGWQVLSRELPRSVHLADPLAPHTVIGPVGLHEHQRFDDRLLGMIRDLSPGSPLRVFLVWSNSD
jgi:hypothetical protein